MAAMTPAPRRFAARVTLAVLVGLAAPLAAVSQPDNDTLSAQRRIEAAYLFKFGAYITWPAQAFPAPDSPLVIGVVGDDEMADELATLVANRDVNGHGLMVRRVRAGQSIVGIHLLFIAPGTAQGDSLIAAARDVPTVAVTEGADGLERGADITFVLVNDRVRFDVSLDAAQHDGVKFSSQLLSVADKVTGTLKP